MNLNEGTYSTTFQSRLGFDPWLRPYTDRTIENMGLKGVKNLAVITPAFVSDCLETLEEIAMEGEEIFHEVGGQEFTVVPCLNDREDWAELLASWIETWQIKDLKKGTVYLQRQQDTIMITLDSLEINGNLDFELYSELPEPELLFLKLDKNDNDEGTIVFFADKGITQIHSTLKNFNFDAKIKGSKQQETLEEYLLVMSKFNDRNLDLIKENFEAKKAKASEEEEISEE